jgi:hypothetical protein
VVLHVSASHGLLVSVMRRDHLEHEHDELDTRQAAGMLAANTFSMIATHGATEESRFEIVSVP